MEELPPGVSSLVDAALRGDDPDCLMAAAGRELRTPLGLVSRSGHPLGWAPRDGGGQRALAVAEAAARSGLVAPPGWRIVPLSVGASALGFLAVGGQPAWLDLVVALLAEQLYRAELVRARVAGLVRRLVGEPEAGLPAARREAAELGLQLADTYWAAVMIWRHMTPKQDVLEAVERESVQAGTFAVPRGRGMVLLYPGTGASAWFQRVVACARRLAPAAGVQAIAADAPVELPALSARVAELEALSRLGPRAGDQPVLSARQFGLDRLLRNGVTHQGAQAFVLDQIGDLLAWDGEHHSDLLAVLEAALDYPQHEEAAHRCYMHRNTFRQRLRMATQVLGHDLEDPDVRLATHVALKLRRMIGRP